MFLTTAIPSSSGPEAPHAATLSCNIVHDQVGTRYSPKVQHEFTSGTRSRKDGHGHALNGGMMTPVRAYRDVSVSHFPLALLPSRCPGQQRCVGRPSVRVLCTIMHDQGES
jgi:hypothetical protein